MTEKLRLLWYIIKIFKIPQVLLVLLILKKFFKRQTSLDYTPKTTTEQKSTSATRSSSFSFQRLITFAAASFVFVIIHYSSSM